MASTAKTACKLPDHGRSSRVIEGLLDREATMSTTRNSNHRNSVAVTGRAQISHGGRFAMRDTAPAEWQRQPCCLPQCISAGQVHRPLPGSRPTQPTCRHGSAARPLVLPYTLQIGFFTHTPKTRTKQKAVTLRYKPNHMQRIASLDDLNQSIATSASVSVRTSAAISHLNCCYANASL